MPESLISSLVSKVTESGEINFLMNESELAFTSHFRLKRLKRMTCKCREVFSFLKNFADLITDWQS